MFRIYGKVTDDFWRKITWIQTVLFQLKFAYCTNSAQCLIDKHQTSFITHCTSQFKSIIPCFRGNLSDNTIRTYGRFHNQNKRVKHKLNQTKWACRSNLRWNNNQIGNENDTIAHVLYFYITLVAHSSSYGMILVAWTKSPSLIWVFHICFYHGVCHKFWMVLSDKLPLKQGIMDLDRLLRCVR